MQFLYCPDCKQVQPRKWYSLKRCASCGGEAIVFKVRTGALGYLSIATAVISLILAGMYLVDYDTPLGDSIVYAFLLFVLLSFIFMFVELGRTQKVAEEMARDPLKRPRV
jgi:hypothetical protein